MMDTIISKESNSGNADMFVESLESLLHCYTCHSRFDQAKHIPKILPCGHTFCQGCMAKVCVLTKSYPDSYIFGCPFCRSQHHLQHKIEDLPNNFTIIQVLDIINSMIVKFSDGAYHENDEAIQERQENEMLVWHSRVDRVPTPAWHNKKKESYLTLTFDPDCEDTEVLISYTTPDILP